MCQAMTTGLLELLRELDYEMAPVRTQRVGELLQITPAAARQRLYQAERFGWVGRRWSGGRFGYGACSWQITNAGNQALQRETRRLGGV